MDGWEKDERGNIRVGPLVGFAMAPAPMTLLLRLDRAANEDQLRTGSFERFQLALTTAQARELAQALLKSADRIDRQPKGTMN